MSTRRDEPGFRLDTLAIHAGQAPDPVNGAVMTPIVLASTFAQPEPGKPKRFDYSRSGNPTRDSARERASPRSRAASTASRSRAAARRRRRSCTRSARRSRRVRRRRLRRHVPHLRHGHEADRHRGDASSTYATTDGSRGRDAAERRAWSGSRRRRTRCSTLRHRAPSPKIAHRARRPARRRQHLRDAGAPAPARARRAPSSLHSTTKYINGHSDVGRRRARHERRRARRAPALPPERDRRRAEPVRLLPRPARPQDAAGAHAAPRRAAVRARASPRDARRASRACTTPGSRATRSTRSRSGR